MNRINFYPQKYGKTAKLVPADFNTLQDYIQAAIENAVKDMIPVPGCLSALDMAVTPNGDWRVVVSAGAGYDETGRRVYNEAAKLLDLGPVMYPVGEGNERYLRVVARAAVNQQEPREDAYGATVYFRQIESAALAVRAGVEAPIGTATVPDAQAGDITRAVVRRYDGQLRIETGDIDNSYGDILGIFVRQGDTLIGNLQGNVVGTASKATNLAGGNIGTIPYQSAEDTTAMLDKGMPGSRLRQGINAPEWVNPAPVSASAIQTSDITTSNTSYTEITDITLSFNLPEPALALILFMCNGDNNMDGRSIEVMLQVDGVNKNNAFGTSSTAGTTVNLANMALVFLDIGTHTIKALWRVTAGTGTLHTRQLHAIAFPSL